MCATEILPKEAIEKAGGVTALAKALGVPVQTAYSWAKSGRIPPWRQNAVQNALSAISDPHQAA